MEMGREGWEGGGRERKGERRQGKGREGSTWISVQGARVPSYAAEPAWEYLCLYTSNWYPWVVLYTW